jgi:hypothetical protein
MSARMPAARRPGRPPLDPSDPSVDLHVKLPSKAYDDLFAKAQALRVSVPELVRRGVRLLAKANPRQP